MIKIRKFVWFPRTLEGQAPWFANFALKFALFYVTLGFSKTVDDAVKEDNETIQWLLAAQEAFEANFEAFRQFRDQSLWNEKKDLPPSAPVNVLPAAPAKLTSAIVERLGILVERIELSDNYTPEIGAQLGIIPAKPDKPPVDQLKSEIKATAMADDRISMKIDFNGLKSARVQRRRNEGAWQTIGEPTGNPFIDDEPSIDGKSEKREYRSIGLEKNEPVGQYSDIVTVYTTP